MKNYQDKQTFRLTTLNNEDLYIYCYTNYKCPNSTSEYATIYFNNETIRARYTFSNRDWQKFKYQNAIHSLISKVFRNKSQSKEREFLKSQVDKLNDFDFDFESFKKRYEGLHPEIKERLAKSNVLITSEEEAESIMKLSEGFSLLMKSNN